MKITAKFLWLMIFTIVAALAIDYIDLHNDEIQATLMLMLPATFILGAMDFRRAWLWGGLIGLSISLSTWTAALLGIHITKMPTPLYTTLIAIVPALIGAYLGVAAQWIMQQIRTSRPAQ